MNHRIALAFLILAGCSTPLPPGAEKGPSGTIAYHMRIESETPRKIEVNGEYIGMTPCTVKVWGDRDGTFHNFSNANFKIVAYDSSGYPQEKVFGTGWNFMGEDKIPQRVYFPKSGLEGVRMPAGDAVNVFVW